MIIANIKYLTKLFNSENIIILYGYTVFYGAFVTVYSVVIQK